MDQTLRKDWAKAAMQFIAANPQEYGGAPDKLAIENFLEKKIGEKFHEAVTQDCLKPSNDRTKIDGILDRVITEEKEGIMPLRKNATYKIALGLKNTVNKMAAS